MKKSRDLTARINEIITPWAELAPESKLGGMTLAEFKTTAAASIDKRQEIKTLKSSINAAVAERFAADKIVTKSMRRVVAGVIADPTLGSDSSLYRAMKYVPDSERASNQVKQAATATKAPTVAASSPSTK